MTEAQYETWQTELSNWGRWGKDDQLGTLNLITAAKRRAAMALVTMQKGAEKNSVMPMKNGIVTRAVLYDIARLKGVPYLAPGDRIFPEDLEAWEKKAGVRVGPGDALVLRWGAMDGEPGLVPTTAPRGSIIRSFRG